MAIKTTSWENEGVGTAYIQMEEFIDITLNSSTFTLAPPPDISVKATATLMGSSEFGYSVGCKSKRNKTPLWVTTFEYDADESSETRYVKFIDRNTGNILFSAYALDHTSKAKQNTYIQLHQFAGALPPWISPTDGFSKTYSTGSFFNEDNKNQRVACIDIVLPKNGDFCACGYTEGRIVLRPEEAKVLSTINLQLDAPPTFNAVPSSSYPYYKNVTPYVVEISESTAQYDGDIVSSSLTIGNRTVTGTGDGVLSIIPPIDGEISPVVTVTDSRGQVTEHTLPQITVNDYNAPSILNYRISRCDTNGKLQDDGENAILAVDYSYFNAVTNIKKPITKNGNTDVSATTTWYTTYNSSTGVSNPITFPYSAPATGTMYGVIRSELDKDSSFPISLQLVDGLDNQSVVNTQTLPPTFYTIDFLAGGKGVAFGAPSREEKFKVAMVSDFLDMTSTEIDDFIQALGLHGKSICPYDVGDIYITRNSTNPATKWQGTTWRQIKDTFLLAAGDDYTAGDTGGEAEVTLTDSEIPSHTHNRKTLSGTASIYGDTGLLGDSSSISGIVSKGSQVSSSNRPGWTSGASYRLNVDASHEHDVIGDDQPHNNMPPYLVVYAWERLS